MKNNIPQGYKATPLGIIPQEWEVKSLHYLGQIYSGGTPDTEVEEYWNGNIAWCTPSDITKLTTKYIECTDVKITDRGLKESSATLLPPQSIVVCTRATIGNAAICKTDIATNQGFKNIIPNKETNSEWLYYVIIYSKPRLVRLGCGSTFLEVSKKDFSRFKIPVPPLAEQRKIAEVLGLWDKAIEKQSQLIEQLTLRKRGLMQQLLTAKRRLPGFSSLCQKIRLEERCEKTGNDDDKKEKIGQGALISQGYKPTSFGFIPQEWVVMPLSKAFRIQSGYAFKSELFTKNCGTPVVRISNLPMNDKYIDLSDCVYYPVSIDVKEQFIIHKNDFLIAMSGATTGKSAIYNYDYEALLNQRVGVFRQISDKIDNQYLHIIMESQWFIFQLQYLLIAGAQPNISPSDVENMVFPIPSLSEQKAIAQVLTAADREIELAQQKLELLRQQKRGLMQQLLTGKKRVKY